MQIPSISRCTPQRNNEVKSVCSHQRDRIYPAHSPLPSPAFLSAVSHGKRLSRPYCSLASQAPKLGTIDMTSIAPHRYLVLYRNATIPGDAEAHIASAGARLTHRNEHLGIAVVEAPPQSSAQDDAATLRRLAAQPNVELVLHDRIVSAHRLRVQSIAPTSLDLDPSGKSPGRTSSIGRLPTRGPILTSSPYVPPSPPIPPSTPPYDTYYTNTPQGWAVQQVGGYGANVPGGPAHGPWDTTMGKGVRIAIIDSGVDQTHPDIAPNLALNLTEIDPSAYPTTCDDGTPQDQTGHGTWTASLAAGAIGPGTGQVIGVAPAASILNIKVLQRMPAAITGDTNPTDLCEAGEASGLLSWVMQGIEDAITNRADVISLSIGATADLSTGDGAGLLAAFNRITYAAAQANIVLVASAGNDGLDLSNPQLCRASCTVPRRPRPRRLHQPGLCPKLHRRSHMLTRPGQPRLLQQLRRSSQRPRRTRRQLPRWRRYRRQRLGSRCLQLRKTQHSGRPPRRPHPQLRLFQSRPYRLRPGHGHQRLRPPRRWRRRSSPSRTPRLDGRSHRHSSTQLSCLHSGTSRPRDQRRHSPDSITSNAITQKPLTDTIPSSVLSRYEPVSRSHPLS